MNTPPHIYQINTWTWLHGLRETYQDSSITLGSIPDPEIEHLISLPIDIVWLMGVWERSPAGVIIATELEGLQRDYRAVLPDFTNADVSGSPYSIRDYEIDPSLGTRQELQTLRATLADYGIGLLLDYVPNHVATDHAWTATHPEYLMQGTRDQLKQQPDNYFEAGDHVFAFGRDPYFPAWTDTVQVNAFEAGFRAAAIDLLKDMAALCDGVRCDMAMLLVNRVFQQTWGVAPPSSEFWEDVIPAVKATYPDFLFIAEVYWNMEAELLRQGFDYCYDKGLYDVLEHGSADDVRTMLDRNLDFQSGLVRFIENHDEPRAVTAFGFNRAWMAALTIATLSGAKLWHEGQFVGHRMKLPVQLCRRPFEADDEHLFAFYQLLLNEVDQDLYREGSWQLRPLRQAWANNSTYKNLYAYSWHYQDEWRLIVVNYSNEVSQGAVVIPDIEPIKWSLRDIIGNKLFERRGDDLKTTGLYVDLPPWSGHLFRFIAG